MNSSKSERVVPSAKYHVGKAPPLDDVVTASYRAPLAMQHVSTVGVTFGQARSTRVEPRVAATPYMSWKAPVLLADTTIGGSTTSPVRESTPRSIRSSSPTTL